MALSACCFAPLAGLTARGGRGVSAGGYSCAVPRALRGGRSPEKCVAQGLLDYRHGVGALGIRDLHSPRRQCSQCPERPSVIGR